VACRNSAELWMSLLVLGASGQVQPFGSVESLHLDIAGAAHCSGGFRAHWAGLYGAQVSSGDAGVLGFGRCGVHAGRLSAMGLLEFLRALWHSWLTRPIWGVWGQVLLLSVFGTSVLGLLGHFE
jgi:hypothetical protein